MRGDHANNHQNVHLNLIIDKPADNLGTNNKNFVNQLTNKPERKY